MPIMKFHKTHFTKPQNIAKKKKKNQVQKLKTKSLSVELTFVVVPWNNSDTLDLFSCRQQVVPDFVDEFTSQHVVESDINVVALFP